ncbi:hypothetical protein TSUD_112870 [Trifolium subterraneum]|uniref:PRONE domain-containing protein n=1 Tax=Trifolium subterraneum TaxID=3900 RepID=A0A2Z6M0T5_TRISU|nr:hypothetical protein TSUD_112870 [Trifolium subterraneum]
MVRAGEQDQESYRSKLFNFRGMFDNNPGKHAKSLSVDTEMEQMKMRFAKLLLGEDMSGGGKGVSSALALSNAFTNLAASIFGEQRRLEPMPAERKATWRKEIDLLLSVTDHIVEMVPSKQTGKDGSIMEIMTTRQRTDLHMNIPALRKLDTMLLECLDNFKDQQEFYYVSKDADKDKDKSNGDEKWWLPTPKVPEEGLSDAARKFLQYQKDCVNQNGRASLGDAAYRCITVEFFDPDQFLSTVDLSSEHKILDLKNRIEASIIIWKRKMNQKDSKSGWGSADVGHAVLESYSRILESLAFTVLSRIDDVLQADYQTQNPKKRISVSMPSPSPKDETDKGSTELPGSMTLSDFMGWGPDQADTDTKNDSFEITDDFCKDLDKPAQKIPAVVTNKKVSYLETLGVVRSPTSRH